MEGRWEFAKIVLHFHLKRKLSFKQRYLQWQWFSSWKNILSTFRFDRPLHHSTPETEGWGASWEREQRVSHIQRDQEALQLQFIRHHDVLFLEPKSFGVLTTIFSVWFLAGKKKKIFFLRSSSGKAPHPISPLPAGQTFRNMARGSSCLWVFISLRYWGRHLMCLLTEIEGAKSFKKKVTMARKAFQRWRVQYFDICKVFWWWQINLPSTLWEER